MGKGTTTSQPVIPPELSGLYSQSAQNMMGLQDALPLWGSSADPIYRDVQGAARDNSVVNDRQQHKRNVL